MEVDGHEALVAQRKAHPELSESIDILQNYVNGKLYHQLTNALIQYLKSPVIQMEATAAELLEFFNSFIKQFEHKFEKVRWVQILATISKPQKPDVALELITPFEAGVNSVRDAKFFWQTLKAEKLTLDGQITDASQLLESLEQEITNSYEVNALTQSYFHQTYALLWRRLGNLSEFYKSSLMYLAFTKLEDIPLEERPKLAFDISAAAMIAPNVFSFGELMQNELLTSLEGSQFVWIKDLLKSFAEGKIELFEEALMKHQDVIQQEDWFKNQHDSLRRKIQMFTLVEMAFRNPKNQRRLKFEDIAANCHVGLKEVEDFAMKCMAEDLIKGRIDEVNQIFTVTWVRPRILDSARLDIMRERIDTWAAQTGVVCERLNDMAPELLVS